MSCGSSFIDSAKNSVNGNHCLAGYMCLFYAQYVASVDKGLFLYVFCILATILVESLQQPFANTS